METILVFLIVIILLSLVDLTVGVANDAVNFLNSAVGSKVTTFRKMLIVASIGLLFGVTLSSGMMEVARKGIFNPSSFTFYDVMVIFVAFAITDVLLLDFLNTFGIPISTTVSMISSLTGASLGITIIYLLSPDNSNSDLGHYLNLSKLTIIYSAIILSIVISFLVGYLSQFFSRVIFSFNYHKHFRLFGPLWSSFSITMILFFVSIKGLEGAVFSSTELYTFITENRFVLLLCSFIFWSIIFYFLELFLDVNKILKIIVLIGIFALAMAFASNDLVNYIGPGLAAWNSYNIALSSSEPLNLLMDSLKAPIKAPPLVLLFSGLIMITTLFLSKKARSVTRTEVSLARQTEGYESFEGFGFARSLVRSVYSTVSFFSRFIPQGIRKWINSRFNTSEVILMQDENGERASFDLIRATVNLAIASGLISFATSLKLPLSTTYVTFIVAMSTAFADRAWGRENAVQRVSGILTVVGGWFITAIICIIFSGIISTIIYFTGIFGVLLFLAIITLSFIKTSIIHRKREKERKIAEKKFLLQQHSIENSFSVFVQDLLNFLQQVQNITNSCIQGISKHKLKELKKSKKQAEDLLRLSDEVYKDFAKSIKNFDDEIIESIYPYTSALGDVNIVANQVHNICERCFNYVDNSQKPLTNNQISDLKQINKIFNDLFQKVLVRFQNFQVIDDGLISFQQNEFDNEAQRIYKTYLKRMKKPTSNTNRVILYLFLTENIYSIVKKIINLADSISNLRENIQKKLISTPYQFEKDKVN